MRLLTCCVLGVIACGGGKTTVPDGPTHDSAASDARRLDDASTDSTLVDAAMLDAMVDAGLIDAAMIDAGLIDAAADTQLVDAAADAAMVLDAAVDAIPVDAATDAVPADAAAQPPGTPVDLGAYPVRITSDPGLGRFYVSLSTQDPAGSNTSGAGISVFDLATNALVTTIANPMDADLGAKADLSFDLLALDPVAHRLYAGSTAASRVYIIDLTTNAIVGHFDGSAAPANDFVSALTVDPSTHVVYLEVNIVIEVFDGTTGLMTAAFSPSPVFPGSSIGNTAQLAVDPTNHLLFVCGKDNGMGQFVAQAYDTTTRTKHGGELAFGAGQQLLDCSGANGTAVAVTSDPTTSAAVVHLLEPMDVMLPTGVLWNLATVSQTATGNTYITAYGTDTNGTTVEWSMVTCGENVIAKDPAPAPFDALGQILHGWMDAKYETGMRRLILTWRNIPTGDGGLGGLRKTVYVVSKSDLTTPCP